MDEEKVPAPHPEQDAQPLTRENEIDHGPMTPAQASYLHSLCDETGEEYDDSLSAAAATERIRELRAKIGRADRRG